MSEGGYTSLLPYFVASLIAIVGVLSTLFWSGALQLKRWVTAPGYAAVGDFDNVSGVASQEACFKLCNNAYVAGTYTDKLPSGYNCQLFRSVACGYRNTESTTKYNPVTVVNDPTIEVCAQA